MTFHEEATLKEVRDWLRERLMAGEAHRCPVCTQNAKVYRRKINSRQALTLIEVYRAAGMNPCHVPSTVTFTGDSGEISKLRYWGLVEECATRRDDGGRAGWWRITLLGASFVRGDVRVPKYARIFDGRCLGLDPSETVTIQNALGDDFSYNELMGEGMPHAAQETPRTEVGD